MIDVRRVAVLREVARLGSFNQAAASLRLTPSAVSQQISALERELGAAVVIRSTRGVDLTNAGRVLVEAGDAIAAELSQAEREIARLGTPDSLTVATFTSGGQRLLPPALTRFAAERPGVELTVLENEPADALPLVRSGAADLALVYHFDDLPPVRRGDRSGLTWTPLLDDPMWIVLPDGHRLASRESLTIAELAGERWVHGCLEIVDMLDHYAALAGYEIRTACRGTDYVFAQSLVRADVGISMIPQVALTAAQGGLATVPLAPPCPCRYIGIVTPQRRRPNPLTEALVQSLHETVAALPALT
ncbi:LysR family transcriptional regulator [Actinoplanes sp. LDG1-06]|uniref:LysR family transcriptional regulator n=1 Tax=Paractinoplanes ovalisporus TaxID=2810368 RepID=A0ABS2AS36_9ACTN|nr:LysR family transcriptional regulator [Actinoplanes ovalisporus]MBM2622672.1 LysR family transcriptional regulator [Actinoplanes ovalisporus]